MRYMTYIPVVPRGGLTERVVHDQLPKINKSGDCSCTPQQGCFGMGDYTHNNTGGGQGGLNPNSQLFLTLIPNSQLFKAQIPNSQLFI